MAERNILDYRGMNTVLSSDLLTNGQCPYGQNVRRLLQGRTVARPPLGANQLSSILPSGVTSLTRMNDSTANGPVSGFVLISGAAGKMYVNATQAAAGLSGNPLSYLPYRPSQSPQPWCYIGDPSLAITIPAGGASPGYGGYTGPLCGMVKVRSDGTVYKTGIMEPQVAPVTAVSAGTGPNWVSYRYTFRSKETGAVSNPSPESAPAIVPQTSVSDSLAATSSDIIFNGSQYEVNGSQLRTVGSVSAGTVTDYVIAHNFGLSVPTGVNVDGVLAATNWLGQYAGTGIITAVALFYQGQIIGQIKAPGLQNQQSPGTATQGGDSDSWGTVLTPAIVNDSTFGIGFQVTTQESGGSDRSFFNNFTITVYYTTLSATVTPTASTDPQVDTIDIYRMTEALDNFTYVGSIANSLASAGFADTQSDLAIANNPILSFENYEPFPSIDLPRSGVCNVSVVSEEVTDVSILTPGTGQTNGTFVIASTGGGGTGATVQIIIAGGIITTATVLTPGAGYTSVPTFIVAEGGTPGTLAATIGAIMPGQLNVTSVSGDAFNIRWLPGNIINIAGIAYTLYNRPASTTELAAVTTAVSNTGFLTYGYPPAGTNLAWSITVPSLASEPSPVIWGPTPDNAGSFYFGLDPNNPGDLLWSLGNNFDSAPDTNRLYVTSPNEPLMNGTVTSELSTVFSTDRFWLIYPNFADAVATVTGTLGSQWTPVQSASTRGLYMRYAIAALGSLVGWRAKDGIYISQGGGPEQSISDAIYNLFPHGGQAPSPVVLAGFTVYPPDDTKTSAQTMAIIPGYVFYDYQDVNGTQRTLVYDMEAKGWAVDTYTPLVNCHSWAIGPEYEILVGCVDGTIRLFDSTATEAGSAVVATPSLNAGSPRIVKRVGGVFLRAQATQAVSAAFWKNRYQAQVTGTSPASVAGSGEQDYFFDFTNAAGADVLDMGVVLSWPIGSGDWLKEWDPDWTTLPEQIVAWRTGMLSYNQRGWLDVPWLRFAYASTTQVNLTITTDQGASVTLPIPSSGGAPAKHFTLVPAYDATGKTMKFRMMEWVADAGGTPWQCYGAGHEMMIQSWGQQATILKPFRQQDGSSS
jgi:hypothetical protein